MKTTKNTEPTAAERLATAREAAAKLAAEVATAHGAMVAADEERADALKTFCGTGRESDGEAYERSVSRHSRLVQRHAFLEGELAKAREAAAIAAQEAFAPELAALSDELEGTALRDEAARRAAIIADALVSADGLEAWAAEQLERMRSARGRAMAFCATHGVGLPRPVPREPHDDLPMSVLREAVARELRARLGASLGAKRIVGWPSALGGFEI